MLQQRDIHFLSHSLSHTHLEGLVSPSCISGPARAHHSKRGTPSFRHAIKMETRGHLSCVSSHTDTDTHSHTHTDKPPMGAYVRHFPPEHMFFTAS